MIFIEFFHGIKFIELLKKSWTVVHGVHRIFCKNKDYSSSNFEKYHGL